MHVAALVVAALVCIPGDQGSLASRMSGLGVRDAVVISSAAIDEHPVWSPDGKRLAANVEDRWISVEVDRLELEPGNWHGGERVGSVRSRDVRSPVGAAAIHEWKRNGRFDPRKVLTRSGTTIELRQEDLGTKLVVTRKGSQPETRWTTSTENCHGLALSPDDRYVAYVCEENGLVVTTP